MNIKQIISNTMHTLWAIAWHYLVKPVIFIFCTGLLIMFSPLILCIVIIDSHSIKEFFVRLYTDWFLLFWEVLIYDILCINYKKTGPNKKP